MQVLEQIHVLDDQTIGQIAAGEVIERPVSVVKELVENSIDAGAHWIAVELAAGGRERITVHDDGAGIPAHQLALALQRHATSKLTAASELFAIRTLGFRGEGLASIAAAAGSVEVISRPAGHEFGARIEASATVTSAVSRVAAAPGTTVTVRDLFATTPVRRQFLKSEKAEFARISAWLTQLALGWPHISFSLQHSGHEVWSLPAVDDPADRIEMSFGKGSRGSFVPVVWQIDRETTIRGFTAKPDSDRPNRHGQIVFVNGRLVRSAQLGAAWSLGYGTMLMGGRYPYGVLMLQLPASEVDVNIHPAKLEVRFLNAAGVFDAVRRALNQALQTSNPVRELGQPGINLMHTAAANGDSRASLPESAAPAVSLFEPEGAQGTFGASKARALGQIDNTYILVADANMMLVLDQHAAHERVAFEALLGSENVEPVSEPLLFPTLVELNAHQAAVLEGCQEQLASVGIEIELFGETTYRITALPTIFGRRSLDLCGMLDELAQPDINATPELRRQRILATVACHSVVRAHEPLTLQEQITLYDNLRQCQAPHTCPHGRPTMLHIDAPALAKAFNRT